MYKHSTSSLNSQILSSRHLVFMVFASYGCLWARRKYFLVLFPIKNVIIIFDKISLKQQFLKPHLHGKQVLCYSVFLGLWLVEKNDAENNPKLFSSYQFLSTCFSFI